MNRDDVKIIHISSEPNEEREIRSFNSLSNLGYRYIRIINERYKKYPPTYNVFEGKTEWIKGITKPIYIRSLWCLARSHIRYIIIIC